MNTSNDSPSAMSWGRFALVGLATVIAAVVATLIVYYIGGAIVAYDPTFVVLATNGGTIIFTVTLAVIAVLVYAVVLRFAADPPRTFKIIAAVVLVLSIIPDFTYIPTVPGATTAQALVLVAMHVVAAIVIVGMLTTLAPSRPR